MGYTVSLLGPRGSGKTRGINATQLAKRVREIVRFSSSRIGGRVRQAVRHVSLSVGVFKCGSRKPLRLAEAEGASQLAHRKRLLTQGVWRRALAAQQPSSLAPWSASFMVAHSSNLLGSLGAID